MEEHGLGFFFILRQGDPGLDAMQDIAFGPGLLEALGMGDATAGGHPVDLARPDRLLGAHAVPVHDLAGKEIRDRREADMGMGPDIHVARQPLRKVDGTHMVEEDEGANHTPLGVGQYPPDLKPAQALSALLDDEFDHAFLRLARAT